MRLYPFPRNHTPMRTALAIASIVATTLAVLLLGFGIYEKSEELRSYKRAIFGMRDDYKSLQEKIQKLREVKITNTNDTSKNAAVGDTISAYANEVNGDVSIYYKNLTTGESVVVDGERKYYMASLYKVILTLYILEQVKDKKIDLDDTIGAPPITIEQALTKIITESNNEYATALADTHGWTKIEKVMKPKLGIDFTFDEKLETSVANMGKLFEDIALSLKISDFESEYLLKLLNDQQKTEKLPKYLPKNVISHNKTGEFEGNSHDAAIFYTPKANYVLVFMSNTPSPGTTDEQMALMSKEIYETLNK